MKLTEIDGGEFARIYKTLYFTLSIVIVGLILIIIFNVLGFIGGLGTFMFLLIVFFIMFSSGAYTYYSLNRYIMKMGYRASSGEITNLVRTRAESAARNAVSNAVNINR